MDCVGWLVPDVVITVQIFAACSFVQYTFPCASIVQQVQILCVFLVAVWIVSVYLHGWWVTVQVLGPRKWCCQLCIMQE